DAGAVRVHVQGAARQRGLEPHAASLEVRAVVVDRLAYPVVEVQALSLELYLALGNARDVEQVVHHPDEVPDLPIDDVPRAGRQRGARLTLLEDVEAGSYRGQRVAQLVREQGDELALATIGLAQLVD